MACSCPETHHDGANYYVSVKDGTRTGLLVGPFTDHAAALALVKKAAVEADKASPGAWFYEYGTCAMPSTYTKPGVLNRQMGL